MPRPNNGARRRPDARADIYGLGATLYHLLTNVPPLPAFVPTPRVPIQQYNPAVSDATVALVEKALAKDREQRFAQRRRAAHGAVGVSAQARARADPGHATAHRAGRTTSPAAQLPPRRRRPTAASADHGSGHAQPTPADEGYTKGCPQCGTMNRPPGALLSALRARLCSAAATRAQDGAPAGRALGVSAA